MSAAYKPAAGRYKHRLPAAAIDALLMLTSMLVAGLLSTVLNVFPAMLIGLSGYIGGGLSGDRATYLVNNIIIAAFAVAIFLLVSGIFAYSAGKRTAAVARRDHPEDTAYSFAYSALSLAAAVAVFYALCRLLSYQFICEGAGHIALALTYSKRSVEFESLPPAQLLLGFLIYMTPAVILTLYQYRRGYKYRLGHDI